MSNDFFGFVIGALTGFIISFLISSKFIQGSLPDTDPIHERFMTECQEENKWYECHRIWRN